MSEDMVERVARAMAADTFSRSPNEPETKAEYVELVYPTMLPLARAAIEAMRSPTPAMLDAGPPEPYMDADVWAKMVDAALSPPLPVGENND